MPKLWAESIETHRRSVRDAILDATAELTLGHGLRAVTMSAIAEKAGIGRATLYKYFPDVEAILVAWHAREISAHLTDLARVRDATAGAGNRLRAVLASYAFIAHESHGHDTELAALLHRDGQVSHAESELHELIRGLVADAALSGEARDDVSPTELATYCMYSLAAAANLPSKAAVRRLVDVTVSGVSSGGRSA